MNLGHKFSRIVSGSSTRRQITWSRTRINGEDFISRRNFLNRFQEKNVRSFTWITEWSSGLEHEFRGSGISNPILERFNRSLKPTTAEKVLVNMNRVTPRNRKRPFFNSIVTYGLLKQPRLIHVSCFHHLPYSFKTVQFRKQTD